MGVPLCSLRKAEPLAKAAIELASQSRDGIGEQQPIQQAGRTDQDSLFRDTHSVHGQVQVIPVRKTTKDIAACIACWSFFFGAIPYCWDEGQSILRERIKQLIQSLSRRKEHHVPTMTHRYDPISICLCLLEAMMLHQCLGKMRRSRIEAQVFEHAFERLDFPKGIFIDDTTSCSPICDHLEIGEGTIQVVQVNLVDPQHLEMVTEPKIQMARDPRFQEGSIPCLLGAHGRSDMRFRRRAQWNVQGNPGSGWR
mmetsp:Transcript_23169/g.50864  ORF Transcript_23169/g.50864 Transcript_23169/m.50864 type:complete len:253 (-) Transcript_23169:758-1516(-)